MLRLVAFDMDGTLVDVASSWAEVHRHFGDSNDEGLRAFLENRIDDHEFVRSDVRIWWKHRPDLTLSEVAQILDRVPTMPGASELFHRLKADGVRTAIVSGGIDLLAERLARELGIDIVLANGLAADGAGRLTGEGVIRVPIAKKELVLHELQTRLGIGVAETASVGNSDIDVGLFRRSRIGIAFRPADDAIRAAATFVVESGSLTQVMERLVHDEASPGPTLGPAVGESS